MTLRIDGMMGTSLKECGGRFYRASRKVLSPVRRSLDPIIIKLCYKFNLGDMSSNELRLHLGCGSKHFDGFINVDLWITDATNIICDITKLPWPDNSASVIESYHVIEHISHRNVRHTLYDWFRVLRPGGTLILECPHFDRAVREYLAGNEERLINIFGRQRTKGDSHLWGYTPERLTHLLMEIGFRDFVEAQPLSSQSLEEPSLRLECVKPKKQNFL